MSFGRRWNRFSRRRRGAGGRKNSRKRSGSLAGNGSSATSRAGWGGGGPGGGRIRGNGPAPWPETDLPLPRGLAGEEGGDRPDGPSRGVPFGRPFRRGGARPSPDVGRSRRAGFAGRPFLAGGAREIALLLSRQECG